MNYKTQYVNSGQSGRRTTRRTRVFFRYRNLDPEATYDKTDARTDADDGGSALHGMEFQKILDMHLLKQFPPVVCADDSLGLLSPDVKSDWPTPQCENYRGFQFGRTIVDDDTTKIWRWVLTTIITMWALDHDLRSLL